MYSVAKILLGLVASGLASGLALQQVPVLPTDDPFYHTPENISLYQPGDIIASRLVSTDLNGILGVSVTKISLAAAYQFLYRTTDGLRNPIATVTTILVPHNAQTGKLLAYQTAYDSANVNCGPSYSLQAGANNTAIVDIVVMTAALNKGYYIVTSDYEGLNAAFTSGLQAGYATLDAVRVALSPTSRALTGLSANPRCALWGYSGGTIAAEWAAELQPSYAPELAFQGVALGGLIANVSNVIASIDDSLYTGLGFSGIQGLVNGYPDFSSIVESSFVSAAKQAEFTSFAQGCLLQALLHGADKKLASYFKDYNALIHDPVVQAVLNETGQMGQTGVPSMPMYIYKPIGDEVSPVADTDSVYNALCAKGASIEYRRNLVGEHDTESVLGSGSALEWIDDRLAGKPASAGCTEKNVFISALDLGMIESFGLELFSVLENLLGGSCSRLASRFPDEAENASKLKCASGISRGAI